MIQLLASRIDSRDHRVRSFLFDQQGLLFGFECLLIIKGQRGSELKSLICQQCARHTLPEVV